MDNNDSSFEDVNLERLLSQHLDVMTEIMITIIEKMTITLYKTNQGKRSEIHDHLSALICEKDGGTINWAHGKPIKVIDTFNST